MDLDRMDIDSRRGPGVGDGEREMGKLTGVEPLDALLIGAVLTVAVSRVAYYKAIEKAGAFATRVGKDLTGIGEKGAVRAKRDLRSALGNAKRISE